MNASRLAAWLRRVPNAATRLEIRWDSINGKEPIATYSREEITQAGVDELLRATQDHCDDLNVDTTVARARYEIVWLGEDDRVLSTKAVVCHRTPDDDDDDDGPEDTVFDKVKVSDASAHGLTAQLMRHMEVRERMYHSGMATIVRTAMDTLRDQRSENAELRAENRTLRQALRRSEKTGEDGVESEAAAAESIARAEAWNKVADVAMQMLPMILAPQHVRH